MQLILFGHNIYPLLIIFGGSLFLTVGDIIAKLWVDDNKPLHFGITLALYILGLICLIFSFRFKNIAVASMLLIVLNVTTLAIWSWAVYGETLNRTEILGLFLGFATVCLLELGGQTVS
jgi:multidrug transporter EmrE-like cation transporter